MVIFLHFEVLHIIKIPQYSIDGSDEFHLNILESLEFLRKNHNSENIPMKIDTFSSTQAMALRVLKMHCLP